MRVKYESNDSGKNERRQEKAVFQKSSMKTSTRSFMNGFLCVDCELRVCVYVCVIYLLPTIASMSERNMLFVLFFLFFYPNKSQKSSEF